jgi:RNA polymerase sigma-54 factor
MNPQLHLAVKLIRLPIMELREEIQQELEQNPALEILEDKTLLSLDDAYPNRKEEDDYFEATSDSGFIRQGGDDESSERRKFIEGALSRPETLQEHLLWQIRLEPLEEPVRRIGELLIQNLDENGFHKEPVELLLKQERPDDVKKALAAVWALDPAGTCTADYRESLRVQAGLLQNAPPGLIQALDHLEELERGRPAELAKLLGRTEAEAALILERIKELSPFPGRRFAPDTIRYVVPDIQVIRKEGEFVIILNDEEIPVLGINPFFMKMSGEKGKNRAARNFAQENIREARWFIKSITYRNHTLLRVSRAILEFQRDFFVHGPKYIAPLTLRDIAQELGIHEATVSRTANGKYMQTEWGIFEIRHFFTNSISGIGSAGSRFSKEGVKEIIKELIGGEDRRVSDQGITELLAKRGIRLARRTVTKYRKELDLGSSYTR